MINAHMTCLTLNRLHKIIMVGQQTSFCFKIFAIFSQSFFQLNLVNLAKVLQLLCSHDISSHSIKNVFQAIYLLHHAFASGIHM